MKRIIIFSSLLVLVSSCGFAQHEKSANGHEHNPWCFFNGK